MKFRSELDPEILPLNALHTDGTINEEEGRRRLDVLARLANIDNFLMGLDQELEMARVISTVEGNLGQSVWTITYNGEGHCVAEVGTGTCEHDERTGIAKPVADSAHGRADVPNPYEAASGF